MDEGCAKALQYYSGEQVFEGTALPGAGYARVCGDCTDFCRKWPGETKEHYVNTFIATCDGLDQVNG